MKFDIEKLSKTLQASCPEVVFAILHGSSKDGFVNAGSDIDVALYIKGQLSLDLYSKAMEAVAKVCGGAEPDIGILNNAEPVYRFEALKGRLLFNNDLEKYLYFFSLTCREYESQIVDYQRQQKYRIEAMSA